MLEPPSQRAISDTLLRDGARSRFMEKNLIQRDDPNHAARSS